MGGWWIGVGCIESVRLGGVVYNTHDIGGVEVLVLIHVDTLFVCYLQNACPSFNNSVMYTNVRHIADHGPARLWGKISTKERNRACVELDTDGKKCKNIIGDHDHYEGRTRDLGVISTTL